MKQLILAVWVGCLLFAPAVEATTISEGLAYCRANDKDTERLACYDKLARAVAEGIALPTLSDSGIGQWRVRQEISPIDDSRNVYMSLLAEKAVDVRGWVAIRPILTVRCKENTTEVLVSYNSKLESSKDYITVLTRFDQHSAQEHLWNLSTDREAIFALKGVLWASTIADAQKLFVRVIPESGRVMNATFQLKGSAEAMRTLSEACGWGMDPPLEKEVLEEKKEIVKLWRVEKKPVITKKVKPKYPPTAQKDNITGKVFVTALVGKDGKVEEIGKITGPKVFHEAAKAAALQSEFTPAMQNDRPVKVWVSLPFTFR